VTGETDDENLQAIRADLAELAAKVDHISSDIAKGNRTPGELKAASDDLTRLQREIDKLLTRVEQLEERECS
jgi:outer membrane murein-binding lipoprotein Lpp